MIDHESLIDEIDHFDPLSHDQVGQARLIVAGNAEDAEDAIDLMMALGIHPSQETETCESLSRTGGMRLPSTGFVETDEE
jgi:pentatricopeptide repeat protein